MASIGRIAVGVAVSVFVSGATLGVAEPALAAATELRGVALAMAEDPTSGSLVSELESIGDRVPEEELPDLVGAIDNNILVASNGSRVLRSGLVGWRLATGPALIVFPVEDRGVGLSTMTVTLDASGAVVGTYEILVTASSPEGLKLQQWSDGELVTEDLITATVGRLDRSVMVTTATTSFADDAQTTTSYGQRYTSASLASGRGPLPQSAAASSLRPNDVSRSVAAKPIHGGQKVPSKSFWTKFNSCLANAGVAAWMIALIASVCAAAGVGTAGAAFVACAVGTVGGASGTLGYCYAAATA